MLNIDRSPRFLNKVSKIRDKIEQERVKKRIEKITENPETGKPMRFSRKGTREVYMPPFRISYIYLKKENSIIFLDLYHKDKQ